MSESDGLESNKGNKMFKLYNPCDRCNSIKTLKVDKAVA